MIKGIIFDFNRTIYNPELARINDGVINLLERLVNSGYKLCLLSKKTIRDRRKQISELGLDKYFINIQVIDGDKTEQNFERCIDVLSLDPSEIAVVGDRIKKEIYLGNHFGMTTIWYKSGKFSSELPQKPDEEPHYTITRLEEILQYLNS